MRDLIVKDSTMVRSVSSINTNLPGAIRYGMVIDQQISEESKEPVYIVEINAYGRRYILSCRLMGKFGHLYHYEHFSLHKDKSIKPPPIPDIPGDYSTRSGETVVVAELPNGEGIILGCLNHQARTVETKKDISSYISSFNGLKTEIKDDGSYKITFNGKFLPTAEAQLKTPVLTPPKALPDAVVFNPLVAGSYFGFDDKGSYEVSDGSKILPQSIKIDKSSGSIAITSGLVTIVIDKKFQKINISSLDFNINAKKSIEMSSAKVEISGLADVKIKGAKIAIGFGGVELIDSLVQLIDAIGSLTIPHHLGPCSPIAFAPTWAIQVLLIKTKLQLIKGSL